VMSGSYSSFTDRVCHSLTQRRDRSPRTTGEAQGTECTRCPR
jgi:hypothetical protein